MEQEKTAEATLEQKAAEVYPLYVSWADKKKEIGEIRGDETLIAMNYMLYENMAFHFIWLIGTY